MEGIIYKVQPYQETSKLCYVFTPNGKKTLHAKGAQKLNSKDRTLTQYLTHITFEESNQSMFTLKDAKLVEDYGTMKASLEKMKEAAYILELIDKLILDQDPHKEVFDVLLQVLSKGLIEENVIRFSLFIMHYLGYDLQLDPDGRTVKGFHIPSGRLIYDEEPYQTDLSIELLIELLHLKKTTYDTIIHVSFEHLRKLKTFMKMYIEYHLHLVIKN